MANWDDVRILEVGDRALFAGAFPRNTTLFWTGVRPIAAGPGRRNFGFGAVGTLLRAVRGGEFDVIVCYPPLDDPFGTRFLMRLLGRYFVFFPPALLRGCGVLFLRLGAKTPLAVLDTEDGSSVERHNFWLFSRCRAYFKRELPPDVGKVFVKTAHPHVPTARVRRGRFFQEAVGKLRPLSLGVGDEKARRMAALGGEKTADVFFAGALGNSTIRTRGAERLRALGGRGVRVDLAGADLTPDEYAARCAGAWLTWSPEGLGWDCFRHYEAAACGSVPLISQPTIFRCRPLQHGVHCFYYDVEGDGLERAIVEALGDKGRLAEMARAAREFVLRHHTHRALCEYVLEVTLNDSAAP